MQNSGLDINISDSRALTPPTTATTASVLLSTHSGEGSPQVTPTVKTGSILKKSNHTLISLSKH